MSNIKWGIWVIGDDMGRGDPEGHWYRVTNSSGTRAFNDKEKAERHKLFMDETAKNCSRECTHSVEEFKTELIVKVEKPKVWKKGMS